MKARGTAAAALAAVLATIAPAPAFAHGGGHKGGCEEFGQLNGAIARGEVTVPGFETATNLGQIVSTLARTPDDEPGVGDIVRNVDHAACG